MPDNKLTDSEIKKALECCIASIYGARGCVDCPLFSSDTCKSDLCKFALDLINRLQAEKEELKTENQILSQKRFNIFERIEYSDKLKVEAYKEYHKKFEKNIKDVKVTLGQTWEIQNALKKTLKELVGEEK